MRDDEKVAVLYHAVRSSQISRREMLRRALVLGVSASGVAALLAACGGGSAAPTATRPTGTTGAGTQPPSPTTGSTTTGSTTTGSTTTGSTTTAGTTTAGTTPTAGSPAAKPAGKPGGELVYGLALEPDALDPAVTPFAPSHTVMMNIYDTLVWRGKDGKFSPGLAERWETSPDGLSYTFYLRKGIKFHDGTPFTAEAIKVQFDRTADPATKSGFASTLLGPYDHTEIVDDNTAKVVFKAPFAPFLDGASQAFLGICSPAAIKKDPKSQLRNPVGTGFMKFVEWVEKDHISLVRNPDYNWAPSCFNHSGPAYLDKVTYRFYTDDPTRLAALEAGDVQMTQTVPTNEVKRIKGDSRYVLDLLYNPGVPQSLHMNVTKAPLDDVVVRQAISQSIDRKTLIETGTFGTARAAYGPLNEGTPDYSKAVESYYPFDLEKAKGMLQQAGWVPGPDGIRMKNGQKLSVSWIIVPSSAAYDELMQAQMRNLGVDAQLSKQTTAAFFAAESKGDVHLGLLSFVSSDPVILSNFYHSKNAGSGSGFNWSKVKDPKMDSLLDDGERTIDEAKRAEIYAQIQKMVMDNAYTVPLFSLAQTYVYQKKYQDIKEDFRNYVWLYDAYIS